MLFDKNHAIRIKGDSIARMYAITVNNSIRKINKYKQTNPYHIYLTSADRIRTSARQQPPGRNHPYRPQSVAAKSKLKSRLILLTFQKTLSLSERRGNACIHYPERRKSRRFPRYTSSVIEDILHLQ